MPTLHELQRSLRRSIVERETTAAAAQVIGDGLTPAERLSVYRNTFVSSLTNALRLCYPAVHRLVGADFFDSVAQLFIQEQQIDLLRGWLVKYLYHLMKLKTIFPRKKQ